jgi:hypothetical protein
MTSQELSAWLQAEGVSQEEDTSRPGARTGEQVLAILQKRRTDLTDEDVQVMYDAVDAVEAARAAGRNTRSERLEDHELSRHRLMRMGHDPGRPG